MKEKSKYNDHDSESGEGLDFDHATKKEIIAKIREIKNEENVKVLDRVLKTLKTRFDELYEISKNEALQKFVSEGNEDNAFEYHEEDSEKEFISLYGQLLTKRNKYYKDLAHQKEDILRKKEQLLEQLREIVDAEESVSSIGAVRKIQDEWKSLGAISGVHVKTFWANYHALLDRYYDNRSIYFELKDLDRKKNKELKLRICEKAEGLNKLEKLDVAIHRLNELHEEFKHIGPVLKEDRESIWQRFKTVSDAIYARRKEYFESLKIQFEENLVKKEALIKKIEEFNQFDSDRISEWNTKTKEILKLQKEWEAIGGVPRNEAKVINKTFWNLFKAFFSNKNQFFKKLDSMWSENLIKKQGLIKIAEELKDSEEWDLTSQKLKDLQVQWKNIGTVPEKVRNEVYAKFKIACDHFFNRKRIQYQEQFKAYDVNLELKLKVCDQLKAMSTSADVNFDDVYDLINNYMSIGYVSKNAIKKIRHRFDDVVGKLLSNTAISEGDRIFLKNYIQLGKLKRNVPDGEHKIQRKEHFIKRKISTLENNIVTWNTNIDFFTASAVADKLKVGIQQNIDATEKELEDLRSQLVAICQLK